MKIKSIESLVDVKCCGFLRTKRCGVLVPLCIREGSDPGSDHTNLDAGATVFRQSRANRRLSHGKASQTRGSDSTTKR